MRELSLHIIDIAENSIAAKASLISIEVFENLAEDKLTIDIKDNGCGMSEDMLKQVKDPFTTSRKTRKVGLGLSLLEAACERCDGKLDIRSKQGEGTEVLAIMKYNHIDREPLGRIDETLVTLLLNPDVDIVYTHKVNEKEFIFDSREIKKAAGGELGSPEVLQWIREFVCENLQEIGAGLW